MLSTASRLKSWAEVRRVRRSFVLPLIGACVGFFLTSAYAPTTSARSRAAAASVESTTPILECSGGLLHSPPAIVDTQRRSTPVASDALAADAPASSDAECASLALVVRRAAHRAAEIARGYDATAPPFRFAQVS